MPGHQTHTESIMHTSKELNDIAARIAHAAYKTPTRIDTLKDGDTFEMVDIQFNNVRGQGCTRRVRWVGVHGDTTEVCTTYCGETYTLPSDTPIIILT